MAHPASNGHAEDQAEGVVPLMNGRAPPSDSSTYVSIPVTEEHRNGNPKHTDSTSYTDDGPLVLTPYTFATQQDARLPDSGRLRSKLLLLVGLILLVVVVVTPVAVLLRSRYARYARQAEARRIFEIRAFKHRTAFHFQPEKNWMNDPNGPMYYKGWYHLFYQYNPLSAKWDSPIIWGHAVSTDLVKWQHLEPALLPDQWYDVKGVWSGSATILPDGTPVLLYTGWSNSSEQIQSLAFPANASDPLLRKWVKAPQNPIAGVPAGYAADSFRDPTTAWQGNDSVWRILVGSNTGENGTIGTALLYKSLDFQTWNYTETALHSVVGTGMWECPDFFPVPVSGAVQGSDFQTSTHGPRVKHVLKVSASHNFHDYYSVGTYVMDNDTFSPESVNLDAGIGLRYDYGKFYASKSFYDQNRTRRVLFGWVNESDSRNASLVKGWASVMSVPRQVWLDNRTTTDLIQYPVDELQSLHGQESSYENLRVEAASSVKLNDTGGNQLDMEISFLMPNASRGLQPPELLDENGQLSCNAEGGGSPASNTVMGPFGVYVLATHDFRERTALYFHVLQSPGEGLKILVCSDQSRSSVASSLDKSAFGSFVRVYESDQYLTLRILVDHSIVETFVQGGRTVITSRVYPEHALDDAAHVFVFNNGTEPITASTIRAWNMNSIHITQFSG